MICSTAEPCCRSSPAASPRPICLRPAGVQAPHFMQMWGLSMHYDVMYVASAELIRRGTVRPPRGAIHTTHETLSVCGIQQALPVMAGRDRAPRHRVQHQSRDGALMPHGALMRLPTRPIHQRTFRLRTFWCVQQSERVARLLHQRGLHAGRRGEPAVPRDVGIFVTKCASPRQSASDPATRGNEGTHQGGGPGHLRS